MGMHWVFLACVFSNHEAKKCIPDLRATKHVQNSPEGAGCLLTVCPLSSLIPAT